MVNNKCFGREEPDSHSIRHIYRLDCTYTSHYFKNRTLNTFLNNTDNAISISIKFCTQAHYLMFTY